MGGGADRRRSRSSSRGFTGATPSDDNDGLSVFGFEDHGDLDRTLAATGFTIDIDHRRDRRVGRVLQHGVRRGPRRGAANAFDLQSVATHEIGHFIGLGHSLLGETEMQASGSRRVLAAASVMFPIAFGRGVTLDRTLQPDDIAGVSSQLSGRRLRRRTPGRSRAACASAAAASSARTSRRSTCGPATLVGGFALNDEGEFLIGGLAPGVYAVRVEPLDDASTDSFFDDPGIDTNFRVTLLRPARGGARGRRRPVVRRDGHAEMMRPLARSSRCARRCSRPRCCVAAAPAPASAQARRPSFPRVEVGGGGGVAGARDAWASATPTC